MPSFLVTNGMAKIYERNKEKGRQGVRVRIQKIRTFFNSEIKPIRSEISS
jgi:hypothetical protein